MTVTIDHPRVSAVITTYNVAEHTFGMSQRLAAMPVVDEIVIYDDGSSDSTPALLKDFAAEDSRVRLILASDNQGVASARNEALAHCHGEFVWFADPDDQWSTHLVEVLHQAVLDTGADIAVGRAERQASDRPQNHFFIDGLDRRATTDKAEATDLVLSGAMRGYLWNKLFRRSILPTAPFPAMRSQSDFLGLVGALGRSGSTVFVPDVLYTHVERPGSITRTAEDQVENLRRCTAAVESMLTDEGRLEQCAESFRYFRVWFFAIPAANTPLRTGASPPLVRRGIESALDVVKELSIKDHVRIARIAPRLELQVTCLLLLRNAYPAAYRVAKALRARIRAKR